MKNKILVTIFLFMGCSSVAQVKFGYTAGVQLTNVRQATDDTESRFTFNTGAAGLTKISDEISLHFQLLLTSKGYKYYDSYGYKNTLKPLYVELPVVARFNFKTGDNATVHVGVGGFYAVGIAGRQTYYENGVKESSKIIYGNSEDDFLKRSDFGMVFQLGAAFRENYEGHFFYDLGLCNVIPNATTNTFSGAFGFNLTWYFPSKKTE